MITETEVNVKDNCFRWSAETIKQLNHLIASGIKMKDAVKQIASEANASKEKVPYVPQERPATSWRKRPGRPKKIVKPVDEDEI